MGIITALLLVGCSVTPNPKPQPDPDPAPQPQPGTDPVIEATPAEELLKTMTLEEKVGQLFIVRLEVLTENKSLTERNAYKKNGVKVLDDDMISLMEKYQIGGYVFFGKNISDPEQLMALTEQLRLNSKVMPIITVDEEGGQVGRIAWNGQFPVTTFPLLYDYFADGDTAKAYLVGKTIGEYLSQYGFNTVFAPVADIFTNPDNKVIGKRAFGSDPVTVSKLVASCLDGFHASGIMTTMKHYPGHGDTSSDTHKDTVNTSRTWEELEQCELIPFKDNLKNTELIMVAHITVKGESVPASMSYEALTARLRQKYGYEGLIITDALDMGAITAHFTTEEAAIKAFMAGNDLLLMPSNFEKAYKAILDAVRGGIIPMERLDESVLRILRYKLTHFLVWE